MSIERLQAHYGFTKMPFRRDLAPGMLHRHAAHGEAAARISWCISEHALGVITGEVGAGKTVALRAALATLDTSRHTLIYLGNPSARNPASRSAAPPPKPAFTIVRVFMVSPPLPRNSLYAAVPVGIIARTR